MLARSVSSKLRKSTLNSVNVCYFSLWVVTTTNDLYSSGKPFSTIAMRRLSVKVSLAFLRAVAAVSARIT